jgi:hypothetical protein
MNRRSLKLSLAGLLFSTAVARADVTLLLEEPFGTFGAMNPTGHAAIYLSRICADSPLSLRRCNQGELGVVISRYHRIAGFDWIAIPVIPYLYAVDQADQVPKSVGEKDEAALRDEYRRRYLEELAPDALDGSAPEGEWIQLVGAAYDRTIYAFSIETTAQQDDKLMDALLSRPNEAQFNLLFHNCSDFVRHVIDFYYPRAIHRDLIADVGIMTPKQAARCLLRYSKKHENLRFSSFTIPQVAGTVPRSTPVRGVLESLTKSKRYAIPLASLGVLHPYLGGSLALAWFEGSRFDPRRFVEAAHPAEGPEPAAVSSELQSSGN